MFKHEWAAIIYGRSYHLDFRFITIPQDFTAHEKDWAAKYILATFSQANKLSTHPRWSLFKNETHCIVGVTCMVRELLVGMESSIIDLLSKDNRGRPLYVFVGYVTKLDRRKQLLDFPPYTDRYLQVFQNLYQYILEVWWIEEYCQNSKKPILNQYQTLDFCNRNNASYEILNLAKQINHQAKYPNLTYLWSNTTEQKQQLWVTSAVCHQAVSICLGDRDLRSLSNRSSPFLNQTVISNSSEILEGCAIKKIQNSFYQPINESLKYTTKNNNNLSQMIKEKVKEDIEVTLHHAKAVHNKSQKLLQKVNSSQSRPSSQNHLIPNPLPKKIPAKQAENNFGFKAKSPEENNRDREWF